MVVPQLLLESLEDLSEDDFKKFKWYLTQNVGNSRRQVARYHLESPHRHDTVSRMIDCYGEETAVNVAVDILRRMNHSKAAEDLKKTYIERTVTSRPLVTSPASNFPTGWRIPAGGTTGAIAPTFRNATNCSVVISGGTGSNITPPTGHHPNWYPN